MPEMNSRTLYRPTAESRLTLARQINPFFKTIIVTGNCGAGKTELIKAIRNKDSSFGWLQSVTTRPRRPTDNPEEYSHVTLENFEELRQNSEFLWTVQFDRYWYGTKKQEVASTLMHSTPTLVHLVPSQIRPLLTHVDNRGLVIFLDAEDDVIRQRLKRRNSAEDPEIRINECRDWRAMMENLDVPFVRIENNSDDMDRFRTEVVEPVIEHMLLPSKDLLEQLGHIT